MLYCRHCELVVAFLILNQSGYAKEASAPRLSERMPYSIPLVKLTIMENNTAVKISRPGSEDFAVIANLDDQSVKNGRYQTEKIKYTEVPDKAYYLTEFEARQLLLTTKSFIETLDEFEKNLQNGRWGQCLYLDAFLPKFIRGFYLLLGASRNSTESYLKKVKLFETAFDVSLNSPLSDERVETWRRNAEGVIKLRIVTKELVYQLKMWEKRELSNPNRNPEISMNMKCEEALDLFVCIYFFIQRPYFCPPHLK